MFARRLSDARWQNTLLGLVAAASLSACGGAEELGPDAADGQSDSDLTSAAASCGAVQWWTSNFTYVHKVGGWWDTDLAVGPSNRVQLRHPSKLIARGVYGWGFMPTFVDQVTGHEFRFLHLRPQHQYTRQIGHVYPAGTIVGLSGGDTWDTGGAGRGYSTGPHLCVQTLVTFRGAFPYGRDRCQ